MSQEIQEHQVQEEQEDRLTLLLANQIFPKYVCFSNLHPLVLSFFEFLGITSFENLIISNYKLKHDIHKAFSLMMVCHRKKREPPAIQSSSQSSTAPHLPVELWDMIVSEFLPPFYDLNIKIDFEDLRVDLDFIDIVEELDGYIFTGDYFQNLHLRIVEIPFNREFYIGKDECERCGILHQDQEEIYFPDDSIDDSIDDNHSSYKYAYDELEWTPGEVRLITFLCKCSKRRIGMWI